MAHSLVRLGNRPDEQRMKARVAGAEAARSRVALIVPYRNSALPRGRCAQADGEVSGNRPAAGCIAATLPIRAFSAITPNRSAWGWHGGPSASWCDTTATSPEPEAASEE